MNTDATVQDHVRRIAERVAAESGTELVLVELGRAGGRLLVRMTIDRPEGVTLDACAAFSRTVGAMLEVEDPIAGPYELEVTSPGLDRRLVKEADYERFRGREARVALAVPLEGRKNFQGVIRGFEGGAILLELEGGATVRLPFRDVQTARLVPDFP